MASFLPSTPFGSTIRWLSNGRLFQFPEEKPGFRLPPKYLTAAERSTQQSTSHPAAHNAHESNERPPSPEPSSPGGESVDQPLEDIEKSEHLAVHQCLSPEVTPDGTILVGWYSDNDPGNPHNWSSWMKFLVYVQINFYTFVIYMSSSIFSIVQGEFMDIYGVPQSVGSLGLALVLLGYGIGPMLFSPLSEIAALGRNPPYLVTLVIFMIITVLTAVVDNAPGFLVLRFLQGFFGSPCLATGAASLADVTSLVNLPYGLWIWGTFATSAPAVAPTIAGFSSVVKGWQWSMWEVLWGTVPCLILLLFLPETSISTILHYRAKRLRTVTGNQAFKAPSDVDASRSTVAAIVNNALIIPWKINALDPAILFTTVYTALVYAIFYSFFEVFPLVYLEIYHLSLPHMGLVFLTAIIAVLIIMPFYFLVVHFTISRPMLSGSFPPPERRLIPALLGSLLVPTGMFIFAWTSRKDIHWVVPTMGFLLIMAGVVTLLQCMFGYMAVAYPKYGASLFAMNDFARSSLAFASILWSGPLYRNLGIAKGTSLIGALTAACVLGIFTLYWFGPVLRKRSRFAG
ncbi:Cycloheximide resistance protein [Arthroderma uncinatum]|uniref:Cycloheximide resistance protein n=1 Tax=Arthroderma uncinatum TaxID=74035 RepID=UPI00144AA3C9|nr:Cycloheximide resistance protein [Arthroderma uncinatum]KAF3480836.1 Cycloheximide resistance protein [Arthroderma uncinatum]